MPFEKCKYLSKPYLIVTATYHLVSTYFQLFVCSKLTSTIVSSVCNDWECDIGLCRLPSFDVLHSGLSGNRSEHYSFASGKTKICCLRSRFPLYWPQSKDDVQLELAMGWIVV